MSWSQVFFVGMFVGCMLVQGNESTGCANSLGTSRNGIIHLGLNCYHWGIHIEVEAEITPIFFAFTSLSYRCTTSNGTLVRNGSLLAPGDQLAYGSWNQTYSFPPGTTCTLLGCYTNRDGFFEVYELETTTCRIPGIESTTGTQLPEGTLPPHPTTEAESMAITTWRSDSQDMMMLTSQILATMDTATLPLSTPLPTLPTTVAVNKHSSPTASVLPTLGRQDTIGSIESTTGPLLPKMTMSPHPTSKGPVSGRGETTAIALVVVVTCTAVVILTAIVTICIMITRYNYKRSSNALKIYIEDFRGDIDPTFKPVEVKPNHKLRRGESLHSLLYTLEKVPKVPIQTIQQELNSDHSDEKSEILSTCEPTPEDVSCHSMFTEDKKYPNDERQDISVGIKKASPLFSTSSYVCDKYTSATASQSTTSDHTFQMSCSSNSEHLHFLEQALVVTSPTSMPCQEPVAQNNGYVQDTDAKHAILRSTNQNQPPQLDTQPTSTAQPNGYICSTHVLQQSSSYSQHLTMNPPFDAHKEIMRIPTESTPADQANGYCSDRLASPQYSSTAPNPKCESEVLLFRTEYDEPFTSIPSTMQLKAAIKNNQPTERSSDAYITEDHVPHYDTNIQNDNQELNPNNQSALPHMHNPGQPYQSNSQASEYIQHPLSQFDPLQTENNRDFIWCFDSASMSEYTTQSSPEPRTGSQNFCFDHPSTQEYVLSKPQNDVGTGSKIIKDGSNVGVFNEVSTGTCVSTPVERDTFQAGSKCYQEEELPWLNSSMLEKDLQSSHQTPMLNYSHSTTMESQVEPEMSASTGANLGYVSQSAVQSTGCMDFIPQPEVYLASDSPDEEEYLTQSVDYTCVNGGVSSSQHEASHDHHMINITDHKGLAMSQSQTTTTPPVKYYTPLVLPSLLSATNQQNSPSGSTADSNEDETACLLWLEDDASLEQRTPNLPCIQSTNVHHTSSFIGMEEMNVPVDPIPSFLPHMQASLPSERGETCECQQNSTIKQHSIELDIPEKHEDSIVEDQPISNAQGAACSGYLSNSTRSSDYVPPKL